MGVEKPKSDATRGHAEDGVVAKPTGVTPRRRGITDVVSVRPLGSFDEDAEDIRYWLSRPVAARMAHVERLRELYHGRDYDKRPFPRVARIIRGTRG